jgi:hypothetical protein
MFVSLTWLAVTRKRHPHRTARSLGATSAVLDRHRSATHQAGGVLDQRVVRPQDGAVLDHCGRRPTRRGPRPGVRRRPRGQSGLRGAARCRLRGRSGPRPSEWRRPPGRHGPRPAARRHPPGRRGPRPARVSHRHGGVLDQRGVVHQHGGALDLSDPPTTTTRPGAVPSATSLACSR